MTHVASDIRAKILVVEDDESVTRILRLSFRSAGFDTSEVSTGGEALHILKRQPPDAVVLDLQLPDGQGGAVLDWLRQPEKRRGGSPVWVVISALERGEASRRYGPPGDNYLAKPFDPWDLVAMLENLLSARGEPQRP
jgi:DNA-binding response OmpR family regulator